MIATRKIQLSKTTHTLLAPGIIRIDGVDGECIELEDALEMRQANLELSEDKPFCLVMNGFSSYYTYSAEAKALFASKEFCELGRGTAFLADSLAVRLMAAFYININRPVSPTQIFSNEEEAMRWLRSINLK